MTDDSAYRKVLRIIGRVRDSPNNNNNEEPEDEYGSVPEHLRDACFVMMDKYLIYRGASLFNQLVKSSHGKNNSFRIFSLKELQKATNNFSEKIWYDPPTYRGTIEGKRVVVKIGAFRNEVVSLSLIKHRNVVKLLGCCLETKNPIVVHELPPNGRLEENISKLSWTDRLRIATEIADALSYLYSELNMTHGHLYSTKAVLLDEFHSAKLGAFDNSKIQNQAESADVQTDNEHKFRKLIDVYHFGRILLNLLCIQTDDRSKFTKVEILKYLKLNVSEKEMQQIEAYIDIFLRCRSFYEQRRNRYYVKEVEEDELSMEEVARKLRRIRSIINHQPTADENQSDNISSGANASTSYQEAKSYY